jgi:hypothetical protein
LPAASKRLPHDFRLRHNALRNQSQQPAERSKSCACFEKITTDCNDRFADDLKKKCPAMKADRPALKQFVRKYASHGEGDIDIKYWPKLLF